MKTVLIAGGVLFALYVLSQNQPAAAMTTPPTGSPTPPAGSVSNALATSCLVEVGTPGLEGAYLGFSGVSDAPPAGNDFQLSPVISSALRISPSWFAARAQAGAN